jgi:hypothetical protein
MLTCSISLTDKMKVYRPAGNKSDRKLFICRYSGTIGIIPTVRDKKHQASFELPKSSNYADCDNLERNIMCAVRYTVTVNVCSSTTANNDRTHSTTSQWTEVKIFHLTGRKNIQTEVQPASLLNCCAHRQAPRLHYSTLALMKRNL